MSVLEATPGPNDALRLIGNGKDNASTTGMTWGNGTPRTSGFGSFKTTYTNTETLNGSKTTYYQSVYDENTSGSAYGQVYDSGGGVFVNDQLAGIMVAIGSGAGDGVTYTTDFSVYGEQINDTTMIPEPSVMALGFFLLPVVFFIRRTFLI
jgi:hypothetical protein